MYLKLFFVFIMCNLCMGRDNLNKMMYKDLSGWSACYRILNGTHQFGCGSSKSGDIGVIQLLNNADEMKFLTNNAQAGPYVGVVYASNFTNKLLQLLKKVDLSGLIVILPFNKQRPSEFSMDDVCPNRDETCDVRKPWNPYGNKFLVTDFPYPVFYTNNNETITSIIDCYNKFNVPLDHTQLSRSLCSIRMKSHMYAAVNSEVCLRRSTIESLFAIKILYCDPMGDDNIYVTIREKAQKSIVIAARIDSTTIFDGISPGASSVTSFVTLLTMAKILNDTLPINSSKSIVFLLFNGESYDYIGSSRFLYDMKYPSNSEDVLLKLENIDLFIDISQLSEAPYIYLHTLNTNFSDLVKSDYIKYNVRTMNKTLPTSIRTFYKDNNSLKGVVVANYDEQFINTQFNSIYDDFDNVHYKHRGSDLAYVIGNLSVSLSKAIYKDITGMESDNIDELHYYNLTDTFLYCFLVNNSCNLIKNIVGNDYVRTLTETVFPLHVGVKRSPNSITRVLAVLLAYYTSTSTNHFREECKAAGEEGKYSLYWVDGAITCINTTLKLRPAVSPAFIMDDYQWDSHLYSTWTESVWEEFSLQMFLKPARSQEIITFCTGIGVMILSFLIVYYIRLNHEKFLGTPPINS